jgi:hypothetical protein
VTVLIQAQTSSRILTSVALVGETGGRTRNIPAGAWAAPLGAGPAPTPFSSSADQGSQGSGMIGAAATASGSPEGVWSATG